jgi:prevent-host-death family protein
MLSQNVGIREVKTNFSRLMKRVQEGQEIIITDRGKPIGKIISISLEILSLEERLRTLENQGLLEPLPKRTGKQLPTPLPAPKGLAQKYLQEGRNQ